MKRIRLALVGLGDYMTNVMYFAARKLPFDLVGVCDIDDAKIAAFSRLFSVPTGFSDYRDMIESVKPDAVLCIANAAVHYEVMKFCLERRIHVFVEKTPCESSKQARELAALQKQAGVAAMAGFNRRFAPGYAMARKIIGREDFGAPAMYFSKFHAGEYRSVDYFIFNHIIHHLDLAIFLLGDIGDITTRYKMYADKRAAFDVGFTTPYGTIGTIQAACMLGEPFPMERLEVCGAAGRELIVDNLRDLKYNRTGPRRDREYGLPLQEEGDCLAWNPNHGYAYGYDFMGFDVELAAFADAIRTGEPTDCDIGDCVSSMAAMEKVRRAVFG